MTIIYPSHQVRMPIVAILGELPEIHTLDRKVELCRNIGLSHTTDVSENYRLDSFLELSESVNDYLQIDNNPISSIHHYVISTNEKRQYAADVKLQSDESGLPKYLLSLLSEIEKTDTFLNVMSDPKTSDWQRLKEYTLFWISVTGFRVWDESNYKDIERYRKNCDSALINLQELYDNPLGTVFEAKDITKYFFYRTVN